MQPESWRASTRRGQGGLKPAGLDVGPVIPLAEKTVESGDVEQMYRLLAADLHSQLIHWMKLLDWPAEGKDSSVAAARNYVQATLGFEVYTNHVYQALHADPHDEHQHG